MAENLSNMSRSDILHSPCSGCNRIYAGSYINETVEDLCRFLYLCQDCLIVSMGHDPRDAIESIDFFIDIISNLEGATGNYVNDAEYESLVQDILEEDASIANGAPPASKLVVKNLENVVIEKDEQEAVTCTICQEIVNVGEVAKKLPCKHGYHDECITNWLKLRNSCPVCRLDLPTDDEEYENKRKRRKLEK